jgi:chromosome segregation protein
MFLKEIIIHGFKSFADKTRIILQPGITTIVGPNGSGKSNILDAIRWVLGEQSAKALRGGKMQDVIFEGTDKRKALAFCEVTLVFSDCEKQLGTAFNEVAITRSVQREKSSNYFINGKPSRLKDVQHLFMDTGIGRVSYSFMAQGQIDQILSSNPNERRLIFEEAAGITRYKSQRKEALAKLELVEQNLSRAISVINEIEKQTASLKRQALKAFRYQKIKHRLSHLELGFHSFQYQERYKKLTQLESKAEGLKKETEHIETDTLSANEALEELKENRTALYAKLQKDQQTIFDLKTEKETAENQSEFSLIRAQDLKERTEKSKIEIEVLEQTKKDLDKKVQHDSEHLNDHEALLDSSQAVFEEHSSNLKQTQATLTETESVFNNKRHLIANIEALIRNQNTERTQLAIELKTLEVRQLSHQENNLSLQSSLSQSRLNLNTLREERLQGQHTQASLKQTVETLESDIETCKKQFRELQKTIHEEDRHIAKLTAQLQILISLQEQFEGFSEGAKAILKGKLSDALTTEAYHLISQYIQVDPAYTQCFESLLGIGKEAIAFPSIDKVAVLSELLTDRSLGQCCVQVHMAKKDYAIGSLPEGIKPLIEYVTVTNNELEPYMNQLLEGYLCIESLAQFLNFWIENPDTNFRAAGTLQGEVVYSNGLVIVGQKVKDKEHVGFLQRQEQIINLKDTLAVSQKKLEKLQQSGNMLNAQLEEREKQYESSRKDQSQHFDHMSVLFTQIRMLEEGAAKDEQACLKTEEALELFEEQTAAIQDRLKIIESSLSKSEAELEVEKAALNELEEQLNQLRLQSDEQRDWLSEVRLQLSQREQTFQFLEKEAENRREQKESISKRIETHFQDIQRNQAYITSLESESRQLQEKSNQIEISLSEYIANLEKESEAIKTIEALIKVKDQIVLEKRKNYQDIEAILNQKQIEMAEERSYLHFLKEKVAADYAVELPDIEWEKQLQLAETEDALTAGLGDLDIEQGDPLTKLWKPKNLEALTAETIEWGIIEKEIAQLRTHLQSIGAVNTTAIQEYRELKERYTFLKNQTTDLQSSKDQLQQAIASINEVSKEMFQNTFEKVRTNFAYTFNLLFEGGQADLELVDNPDMLEAGIEITARPPGTKMKGLSLLSGGQKTMTAVALLFAIYQVKPSPFCVLDELDAPLDDANIGRFTDILKKFTAYSQFLVISHNKRTIAASTIVYGVTMQERGVTSLVSLKLTQKTSVNID